jgi:hypothetical protein
VDRALTLRALSDDGCDAGDFCRPGHVFPLVARKGGIIERRGHTEAAVELCKVGNTPSPPSILRLRLFSKRRQTEGGLASARYLAPPPPSWLSTSRASPVRRRQR